LTGVAVVARYVLAEKAILKALRAFGLADIHDLPAN
jgi:hypothetical protein